jgi:hypothetical protein
VLDRTAATLVRACSGEVVLRRLLP